MDEFVDDNTWIYSIAQDEWIVMPRMDVARFESFAGLVTRQDGRVELVVVGGKDIVSNPYNQLP